jgi:3-methylcrotonyl-CoA carboxylase alpha subunit
VIGDGHGNLVSLFERECTLQRRHQKVIEEAPSPTLNAAQRDAIGAAARKAAGAVKYVGAGTIEFVSDGKEFFFIEMNTRLQVEHPVTELVTGLDLVEWQLRVAFGEKLPLKQDEIRLNGHAVEARLYAENPAKNFMPSVGRISAWHLPEGEGVRVDAGYEAGSNVSPFYDAMLAKVIGYSADRGTALDRVVAALDGADVRGVVTNTAFLSALLSHLKVRANQIDTGFIERELGELTKPRGGIGLAELGAAIAAITSAERARLEPHSPWRQSRWIPGGDRNRRFVFRDADGTEHKAALRYGRQGMALSAGADEIVFAFEQVSAGFEVAVGGARQHVQAIVEGRDIYVRSKQGRFELHWVDPLAIEDEDVAGSDRIVAPLPGTVVAVLAKEGDRLEKGAAVVTLEVMKMEQTLRAPFACKLVKLKCAAGDSVQEGVELAELEPA